MSSTLRADRLALGALLLFPGLLTASLGLAQGGFFPDATAAATVAVLVVLALRTTLARTPFAGLSIPLGVAAATLAGFAGWTLASGWWSDAPARAALEYGRALLYLAVLVLFGLVGAGERRARVLLAGLAGGAAVLCVAALAVWLFPDRFGAGPGFPRARLTWPTSYWNATGLLAGLGALWSLSLTCSLRAAPALRVAGAAAVPACVAVVYLSVSRGAVVATAAGVLVLLAAQRSRGLLAGLAATVPASIVAVAAVAAASGLAVDEPGAQALREGRHAALIVGLVVLGAAALRVVLLLADRRLAALPAVRLTPARRVGLAGLAAVAIAVAAVAADAPSRVASAYDGFSAGGTVPSDLAPAERFGRLSNNGRLDHWRAALDAGYAPAPLTGAGAGTYPLLWALERNSAFTVLDAHSLYVEVLGELGLVGLALLAVALLALLAGLAARSVHRADSAWAGLLAGGVAWALHAGVDWDWEMPALTLPLFAAGGLALGRATARRAGGRSAAAPGPSRRVGVASGPEDAAAAAPGSALRVGVALGCLLLALLPVAIWRSQRELDRAYAAFRLGDCRLAAEAALDARDALGVRPEPYSVLTYCDVRAGRTNLAARVVREAVRRDPGNWAVHYDQALADAVDGRDPRDAAREALRLNPQDPRARDLVRRFGDGGPAAWRRRALEAPVLVPPSRGAG